jgi:hypothetical protein
LVNYNVIFEGKTIGQIGKLPGLGTILNYPSGKYKVVKIEGANYLVEKVEKINKKNGYLKIEKSIEKHNEIVNKIDELKNELQLMDNEMNQIFEGLSKEDMIEYYDNLEDSIIKFDLFIKIKKIFEQSEV